MQRLGARSCSNRSSSSSSSNRGRAVCSQHRAAAGSSSRRSIKQQRGCVTAAAAAASDSGQPDKVSIEELFAAELSTRQAVEAKQAELAASASFDGAALLALLRQKYGRSYDVGLVQRTYLGRLFVAFNVLWKYAEQQSFPYTEEEHLQRLEYVAAALRSWGAVTTVQTQLAATKARPRVGKAVSIMLDVPEEQAREWIAR